MNARVTELTATQINATNLGETLYDVKQHVSFDSVDDSEKNQWWLQSAFVALIILFPLAFCLGVWWFSQFIQVSPDTGLSILIRAGGAISASALLVRFRLSTTLGIIPLLLFGISWSFYPAFDYWLYG